MSNKDISEPTPYTLYLSSNDRVSGNHNNPSFNINFDSFLSRNYDKYKLTYSFLSTGSFYVDNATTQQCFSNCKIYIDFGCGSLSYDSKTQGASTLIGFAKRDIQTSATVLSVFSCNEDDNPSKIISRPNQNNINIQIINPNIQEGLYNELLVKTTQAGTLTSDMTPWNMILQFTPIVNTKRDIIVPSSR